MRILLSLVYRVLKPPKLNYLEEIVVFSLLMISVMLVVDLEGRYCLDQV